MLIIHREGHPHFERAVRITDGRGGRWFIDPEAEVYKATGVRSSREGCIISFTDGLIKDGRQILMDFHFKNKSAQIVEYRARYSTKLVFFLVGLAWSKGSWDELKCSLNTYISNKNLRMRALEHTARHYWNIPSYLIGSERVTLRIP